MPILIFFGFLYRIIFFFATDLLPYLDIIPINNRMETEHTKRKKEENNYEFQTTGLYIAIIGAVNWGLIGFFRFDLVAFLFGEMTLLSRIVYAVVGICGLYLISLFGRIGINE